MRVPDREDLVAGRWPAPDVGEGKRTGARKRMELLDDLSLLLGSSLEPQVVIENLADLVVGAFPGGCAVLLPAGTGLDRAAFRGPDGAEAIWASSLGWDRGVPIAADAPLSWAYRTGDVQILVSDHPPPSGPAPIAIAAPLTARGKVLGVLCLLEGGTRLGVGDVSLAMAIATRGAQALDNALRFQRTNDFATALRGPTLPPGLDIPGISVAADHRTARIGTYSGSTWYDAMELDDGCLFFSLGRVPSGGVEAAVLGVQVRGAMRAYAVEYPSPSAVLSGLDRLFAALRETRLVTAVVGIADPATGEVWLANAGHAPPLLMRVFGPAVPVEGGRSVALGAGSSRSERGEHRLVLQRGERLLCYGGEATPSAAAGRAGKEAVGPAVHGLDHLLTRLQSTAYSDRKFESRWVTNLADLLAGDQRVTEGSCDIALLTLRYTGRRRRDSVHPAGAGGTTSAPSLGSSPWLRLLPVVASAPAARRWVADQLADLPDELIDTAILLTSELVSNAILHAGTDVIVSIHRGEERVRVDVADGNPHEPVLKGYGAAAVTGRGLTLFDRLASAWGSRPMTPSGKIVWFELPLDIPGEAGEAGALPFDLDAWPEPTDLAAPPVEAPLAGPTVEIRLLGVPVAALNRASEQYDALYREFRLVVEQGPSNPGSAPEQLIALIEELGTRFEGFTAGVDKEWRAALGRGDPTVDLVLELPPSVGAACEHYDLLLDQADQLCRAAELMTLPATAEAVALRKWFLLEFSRQAAGNDPVPWLESHWARTLGATGTRPFVRPRRQHPSGS